MEAFFNFLYRTIKFFFLSFLGILAVLLVIGFIYEETEEDDSYNYENEVVVNETDEVEQFLADNYPSLLRKRESVEETKREIGEKIVSLEELKQKFPAQSSRVDRYLHRWRDVDKRVDLAISEMNSKIEAIYVSHKIGGINSGTNFEASVKELDSEVAKDIESILNEIEIIDKTYQESDRAN
jgi:hypothetical protein